VNEQYCREGEEVKLSLCGLILFWRCGKRFVYPQGLDFAAERIGPGMESLNSIADENTATGAPGSAVNGTTEPHLPVQYPYFLHKRKVIRKGYEWQVRQDISGVVRNAGKLRLYGKGNQLIVAAPNDLVEALVEKILQLNSPQK
jgi:hypothetical protein